MVDMSTLLRIEDGGTVWRTRNRFRDEPVDMRMLSRGLLVRSRELDLLDPETGRSLWRERTDRFDEESQVLVDEDAVYLAEKERFFAIDLTIGSVTRLAQYDFHGDEPSRMETSDESLVLMSRQNLMRITRAGEIEYHVYQEAPGSGFLEKLSAILAYASYSLVEANPEIFSQEELNESRADMLETYPALRARYGAATETSGSYYMFTDTPVADREGYSLVQLDQSVWSGNWPSVDGGAFGSIHDRRIDGDDLLSGYSLRVECTSLRGRPRPVGSGSHRLADALQLLEATTSERLEQTGSFLNQEVPPSATRSLLTCHASRQSRPLAPPPRGGIPPLLASGRIGLYSDIVVMGRRAPA